MRTMKTSLHVLKVCVSLCQIKYVLFSFREALIRIVSLIETYIAKGLARNGLAYRIIIKSDLSFFSTRKLIIAHCNHMANIVLKGFSLV